MLDVDLLVFLACRTSARWREASMVVVLIRGMVQMREWGGPQVQALPLMNVVVDSRRSGRRLEQVALLNAFMVDVGSAS